MRTSNIYERSVEEMKAIRTWLLVGCFVFVLLSSGCTEKTESATCPSIQTSSSFHPLKKDETIKLNVKNVNYGGGYKLAPDEKQSLPLFDGTVFCHKGKEAGENVNNIYCDQVLIVNYKTSDSGDILEENYLGVEFVFDEDYNIIEKRCFK